MKKYIVIGLLPLLCYSCSIVTKRGETPAPEVPESVPPPAPVAEAMPTTVKKKISDQDLKKENADQELKKRVVVLPILDRKGIHDLNVLKNVRSAFVDSLNATGELIALDPAVLKLSLDSFVKNNAYDMEAIGKAVAMVGASSLLEIKIVDMRFQDEETTAADNTSSQRSRNVAFDVVVQARMHNIRSGQELFNTVKTVSVEEENSKIPASTTGDVFFAKNPELTEILLKEALLDFNPKLTEALKLVIWEGRIAALQGEKIYLNVGRISGVQIGDLLKVVEDGNEVYDPEMGYHVGLVQGKVKGTLEVVNFFGQDGAVSVIHSGAGFKENDRVEIYE